MNSAAITDSKTNNNQKGYEEKKMTTQRARYIKSVEAWPRLQGKAPLLAFLNGEALTRADAITAKCFECNSGEGGPCTVLGCPLLPYSPYREDEA